MTVRYFIAHSLGSYLIDIATIDLKVFGGAGTIQETFLDGPNPFRWGWAASFRRFANSR